MVNDDNGDLLVDYHSILTRSKNYFCQLLIVCGVNYVRLTEMHRAEQFVIEPNFWRLKLLLKIWKNINRQVLNKFRQNSSKNEVIHYVPKYRKLIIY
jgi:hypothetical protein